MDTNELNRPADEDDVYLTPNVNKWQYTPIVNMPIKIILIFVLFKKLTGSLNRITINFRLIQVIKILQKLKKFILSSLEEEEIFITNGTDPQIKIAIIKYTYAFKK